jgi:hypothetical protein
MLEQASDVSDYSLANYKQTMKNVKFKYDAILFRILIVVIMIFGLYILNNFKHWW